MTIGSTDIKQVITIDTSGKDVIIAAEIITCLKHTNIVTTRPLLCSMSDLCSQKGHEVVYSDGKAIGIISTYNFGTPYRYKKCEVFR